MERSRGFETTFPVVMGDRGVVVGTGGTGRKRKREQSNFALSLKRKEDLEQTRFAGRDCQSIDGGD